ncbi:CE1759 family FMN reductase [Mariniluteicoccus flavus]
MTTLVVITAGLSQPSSTRLLGERLAEATVAALGSRADRSGDQSEVVFVDLRDLARDLTNRLLTHVSPVALEEVLEQVARADAVIAVSPIFNAAYSGLFKLFFDVLEEGALRGRPVLLGATGGTPRHSLAIDQSMLPLFFYLKASVVPTSVFAATDDWGTADSGLSRRITAAGRDLAAALGPTFSERAQRVEESERVEEAHSDDVDTEAFPTFTPFADLLAR